MTTKQRTALVLLIAAGALVVAYWRFSGLMTRDGTVAMESIVVGAEARDSAVDQSTFSWPLHINRPSGPPRIETEKTDDLGRSVSVSCASCHSNMQPNMQTRSSDDLQEFHQGLTFDHGDLSCMSCHNPDNYNTLRLADGTGLAFSDVHMMCAQCHMPQARDFVRGAHGGASGYWDKSRGPQVRKNCIDCHDPHAPAFPSMVPQFKPQDRFLEPPHVEH